MHQATRLRGFTIIVFGPCIWRDAGEREALSALLQDPAWMQAKLNATGGPQALISDYDQGLIYGFDKDVPVISLIGRTLRLIAGILARDACQLMPQLHGRLMAKPPAGGNLFSIVLTRFLVPRSVSRDQH